jgi:hypothetical protein
MVGGGAELLLVPGSAGGAIASAIPAEAAMRSAGLAADAPAAGGAPVGACLGSEVSGSPGRWPDGERTPPGSQSVRSAADG